MSSNDQPSSGGPLGSIQSSGDDNSTVKSMKFLGSSRVFIHVTQGLGICSLKLKTF